MPTSLVRRRSCAHPRIASNFVSYWLGRKQGRLKLISDVWLKNAPAEARKSLGQHFNQLKQQIEQALEADPASLAPLFRATPTPSTSRYPASGPRSARNIR